MSFIFINRQLNPIVKYYYETGAKQKNRNKFGIFLHLVLASSLMLVIYKYIPNNVIPITDKTATINHISQTPSSNNSIKPVVRNVNELPSHAFEQMQSDINDWMTKNKNFKYSVSISEIGGTNSASYNADEVYSLASVYKLFLIQPLSSTTNSDDWDHRYVLSQTYSKCIDKMIRNSDYACAIAIGNNMGWSKIDSILQLKGYRNTTLKGNLTKGTANDTVLLLKNLYSTNEFDEKSKNIILEAMLEPKKSEGIRAGCDGCKVYNKIGNLGGVHNEVAIIEKNNRAYAISIMSKNGSWQGITDLTSIITNHL